jgi:formate-dependent phosphoribosylglycinamide formyltransferase (GAR transformylase)
MSTKLCAESLNEENRCENNGLVARPQCSMAFILSELESQSKHVGFTDIGIKLLIPAERGYVVRSNILQQRMAGCKHVQSVQEFLDPVEEISHENLSITKPENFQRLIHCASGGIVLQRSQTLSPIEVLDFIDSQLTIRMSIQWVLPAFPLRQVVVALGHHRVQSMETFYATAQSLGIRVLLVDSYDDKTYSHCHDGIISVDMTLDDGLQLRIVEALKSQPEVISGIVAYRDHFLVTAARVAEELGLPTLPPSAVGACVNKFAMRLRDMTNCTQLLFARDLHHLKEQVNSHPRALEFPLVVKPCEGQGSVGVSKVTTMQELFDAVTGIEYYGNKSGIIVENYVDGPEIDANFALLEGEILFFEVVDNFPCTADEKENRKTDSFLERDMVYPSVLREPEILMIKSTVWKLLVDNLGFRTGVFHVEARVCGSNMRYTIEDDFTDLRHVHHPQPTSSSLFILEVNARCPGVAGVYPTAYTYGVDFAALWLLSATGDSQRLRALSRPFLNGPQFWCDLVPITVTRGGTLDSDDIMEELRQRRPDLMAHVSSTTCFYRRGDVVPEPSVTNLAGIIVEFVCFSGESRENLLYLVNQIRQEVRINWK